jgi:flagellar motility protein MotE (MotC chaperone)
LPGLNPILKSLIVVASLMLAVRIGSVWHAAGIAFAQASPTAAATPTNTAQASTAPAASPAKPTDAPADPLKTPAAPAPAQKFSPSEVELLQSLSKRRDELDQRSAELDQRDLLLKATEQRIDDKIDQLKKMQAEIDAALGKVDEQEDQHLQSLVRIYEAMKPQDAAAIFDKLEEPVLMQVLTRMKDKAVAQILPHLDGDRARAITTALAERKQVPDQRAD